MQNNDHDIDELFEILSNVMINLADSGFKHQMLQSLKKDSNLSAQLRARIRKIPDGNWA